MKIELTHWESFQKVVPIVRLSKTGEEWKIAQVEWRLNIYKDWRLEYTTDLERQEDNFLIDISEDDILMFEPWEYKAEIEITHGRKKQKQKLDLIIEADQEVDFFDSEENVNKDREMKLYFQEPIDVAIDSFFSDRENVEKFIAPFIPVVEDGYTPQKWVDYDDWYTPIKGKDYKDGEDWYTPKKGVDYFTNKELSEIKKALKDTILSELPKSLSEDEINIKFEDILKKINKLPTGGGWAMFLRQLMDVNVGTPTAQQYWLTYNPSRSEFSLTEISIPPSSTPTLQQVTDEGNTTTNDIIVPDEAYGAGWNGSMEVPTKNAIYDKIETITSTPWGTDWAIQYNNSGTLWGDTTIAYIDDTNDRLGIQNSTPQVPIHWVSETGSTIDNVVTGSVSLVSETLPAIPTGSITQIAEPAAWSGGSASYTNAWSGGFIGSANGTTYDFRIYPCLYVPSLGAYYKSQYYESVTAGSDPNDWQSYDVAVSWWAVSISGESVNYFVEFSPDSWSSSYPLGVYSTTAETFTSQSGSNPTTTFPTYYNNTPWTSAGSPSGISQSVINEGSGTFSGASNGTTWYYELDTYVTISGTKYVSWSAISSSLGDNNNGQSYDWQINWTDGSPSDGLIIRRSNDNSTWDYQYIWTGGSYTDYWFTNDSDAQSRWWQTYSGGTITYNFTPYGQGSAPSGVTLYSTAWTQYSTALPADSQNYIFKHTFTGNTLGKSIENQSNSYGQSYTGSQFYDVGYTSWSSGTTVSPTSYWFTGTNQNRDYKAYSYNSSLGIYWQTPLTLSTTSSGGTKSVSGSVTYPSGITTIKILRQVNGGGYTVSKTLSSPTTSFTDDVTDTTWNGNTTVTPNSVVPWTARFDKVLDSVTGEPHLAIVETSWSGTRYSKLSFWVAASKTASATYQSHLISTPSTGYLSMVTGRLEIASSLGGTAMTMFGNANIINNASSSSQHFQVKGANDASLINTRSDQDTVGFGQAIWSDELTTVQIQPARSSDAGLVMKWHASQSDSSTIIRIQTSGGSYTGEITVGGWVRTSTGAVANPAHSCRSDTNTGIYFPESDVTWLVAWWEIGRAHVWTPVT